MEGLAPRQFVLFALILSLAGACSCNDKSGRLIHSGGDDGNTGGIPGWGGDPFGEGGRGGEGGSGGEAGKGGDGGEGGFGGSGGVPVPPTACETMCDHVEGTCGLQVPGIGDSCVEGCETMLEDEEVACLSRIPCAQEEVEACLGIEEPHRCEALCPFVYDQCDRQLYYGSTPVAGPDCAVLCPLMDPAYLDCIEAAETCPGIDLCNGITPPLSACERMCTNVYDICDESIDQPERSYPTQGECLDACDDGAFTEDEIDCLTRSACGDFDRCFAPTACEEMCDKIYDECHWGLPVGRDTQKGSRDRCVTDCEAGVYTAQQRSCVQAEACEHLATCFVPWVSDGCASACYWVYNFCDTEFGFTARCVGGSCPGWCAVGDDVWHEGELECMQVCQNGYDYLGPCGVHLRPAWSPMRQNCYRQASQGYPFRQCKSGTSYFNDLDTCDLLYP